MKKFLLGFGLFILLYHILVTVVGYKLLGGQYIHEIALIKEAIRIIFAGIFFISNPKQRKSYFQKRKYPWIFFLATIVFAIGISFLHDKSIYSMIVGLKYDFHFLFIFLSSTFIGYFRPNKQKNKRNSNNQNLAKTLKILQYSFGILLLVGFLRQGYRLVFTESMMNLGYGPVGDFAFGEEPPVYYRTGPGGAPRRQGLFSGPNNYGYFLVAFLPLIFLRRKPNKYKELQSLHPEKLLRFGLLLLRLLAIILTLSRTAFIGATLAIVFVHKEELKKLSKTLKIGAIIVFLAGFLGLSILKRGSTQAHFKTKINGIISVIHEPLGAGLGTAGPAVFHEGNILPENFYVQLMVDIGTLGFLLRVFSIFWILIIQKHIYQHYQKKSGTETEQNLFIQRNYLNLGRSCLLVMGLLLHVFEDSMVNYLFFVPYGLITGFLSKQISMPQNINLKKMFLELSQKNG